jgi:ParB/RepB/Spo0J family partition protein
MSKVDMKAFQKKRGEKEERSEKTTEEQAIAAKEKSVASPTLNGPRQGRAAGVKKVERKILHMPITKTDIELTALLVNPKDCLIHPKNRRIQSLLRASNPKIMELKKSMATEGQREPVLARHTTVNGEQRIEIIDGSRRRYVSELISQDDPEFKLKIWLGREIPDTDAEYLTKVENELQEDISAWETAQYLKGVAEANPDWTHEIIAHNENLARSTVSDYLALAGVPFAIVTRLESPDLLAVKSGVQLTKAIKRLDEKSWKQLISELDKKALFSSTSDLLKSVTALIRSTSSREKPTANRKIEIMVGNKLRAAVGKSRSKKGQYKLDLYDVSDDEYGKVMDAIKKILV